MELLLSLVENKKVIVFGTGQGAKLLSKKLYFPITYFVDNDPKKWGQQFLGKTILPPNCLLEENKEKLIIFIASITYSSEISIQLSNMGFIETVHFFKCDSLLRKIPRKTTYRTNIIDLGYKILKSTDNGQLLINDKEKVVLRGFFEKKEATEKEKILNICEENGFIKKFLVYTERCANSPFKDYYMMFKHEYIEDINNVNHWSPLMLYDATKFILDFLKELADVGLTLKDPMHYNMTFCSKGFKYIDFGSLIFLEEALLQSIIYKIIYDPVVVNGGFVHFLLKKKYIGRLRNEFSHYSEAIGFLEKEEKIDYLSLYDKVNEILSFEDVNKRKLRKSIEIIEKYVCQNKPKVNQDLYNYYYKLHNDFININNNEKFNKVLMKISQCINNNKVDSCVLIDLGNKYNKRSIFLTKLLDSNYCIRIVQNDIEINDVLYLLRKKYSLNVIPLFTNRYAHRTIHAPRDSLLENAKSDVVVAFNFVSELVVYNQYTVDEALQEICFYTRKYAVIEVNDIRSTLSRQFQQEYEWLTDSFIESLIRRYFIIENVEPAHENSRFYFCRKK